MDPSLPLIGSSAPDFVLKDQDGVEHQLSQNRASWVLLYFYPKDDTPGCTKEACMIRDAMPDFHAVSAKVFGISVDSVESHKKFAEKYGLPFTLLADDNKEVVQKYNVWGEKKMFGNTFDGTKRTSFLINPEGKIAKVYENVKPEVHATEVLTDLHKLQNN